MRTEEEEEEGMIEEEDREKGQTETKRNFVLKDNGVVKTVHIRQQHTNKTNDL